MEYEIEKPEVSGLIKTMAITLVIIVVIAGVGLGIVYFALQASEIGTESEVIAATGEVSSSLSGISDTMSDIENELG